MSDRDLFYKVYANKTFTCKDGELKINKVMLSDKTSAFDELLNKDVPTISAPDFEVSALTTFFDTLLGFEEITKDSALKILPVARKYDMEDLIQKCIAQLKPKEMNENVIYALNVAMDCGCDELADVITEFLIMYGINRLFLNQPYYFLLEPKSALTLLKLSPRNPLILKSIVKWGKNYMEKNQINSDIRTFFQKNCILNKLSLERLESVDSVLELYDFDSKMNVFSAEEILNYLKLELMPSEPKYEWVDITNGQEVIEQFHFKHALQVCTGTNIYISFNSTLCDALPFKENVSDNFLGIDFNITLQCFVYNNSGNVSTRSRNELTQYEILPVENIGSAKSKLCVKVQHAPRHYLQSISMTYRFRRDCKILKTVANMPKLTNTDDKEKLYFTWDVQLE